jgi:hypothetical protein
MTSGVRHYFAKGKTDKADWQLSCVSHPRVLVVGDSNLRAATSVPPDFEVHSLSGALLHHALHAITRLPLPLPPTIILQAGINNRHLSVKSLQTTFAAVNKTLDFIRVGESKLFFLPVPVPPSIPTGHASNITALNSQMTELLGPAYVLPTLPPSSIQFSADDVYGIHLTPASIDAQLDSAAVFLARYVDMPSV